MTKRQWLAAASDEMTYVISSTYCLGHCTTVISKVGLVVYCQEHIIIVIASKHLTDARCNCQSNCH